MTRILLPNGDHRSTKRGSDYITMDELIQLLGPQAKLLVEFHERLQVIEEKLGIIALPELTVDDFPSMSGDIE